MAALSPLPLPAPEPGPFAGWLGIIVPADEPGEGYRGPRGHIHRSATSKPGKILLLVPPDLLAALRNGQAA